MNRKEGKGEKSNMQNLNEKEKETKSRNIGIVMVIKQNEKNCWKKKGKQNREIKWKRGRKEKEKECDRIDS